MASSQWKGAGGVGGGVGINPNVMKGSTKQ